ncbi:MAG: hypothetical protein ABIN61_04340 [candidate division WOR-3 bacterium]
MIRRLIFLFFSSLIIFLGCKKQSQEKPPFPHFEGKREAPYLFKYPRIDRMVEWLNLSKEQIDSLEKIRREFFEKSFERIKEDREREEIIKKKIVEMVKKEKLSKEEILNFMNELNSIREKTRMRCDSLAAEKIARAHSILTKEQKEELAKRIEEFKPKRAFRRFQPEKE